MSFEALISTYGYAAIAIGTFFEGETILVLGGLAAHRGYLELPWVVIGGFLGTLVSDQLTFYLGRARGMRFLEKRPHWKSKSEKVFKLLQRHQLALTLGFRFLYGLRTVTPFLLGAAGISPFRFLVLNILGAFAWAVSIAISGYLFGHVVQWLIEDIKKYEMVLFIALTVLGAIFWSIHWVRSRKILTKRSVESGPFPGTGSQNNRKPAQKET